MTASEILDHETVEKCSTKGGCGHGHGSIKLPIFGHLAAERLELAFAVISAVALLSGWAASLIAGAPAWLSLVCYATAYLFGGFFATIESLQSLLRARLEIDSLMVVAAAGAASIGHWAEGALLLTLFSIGHALEHYAMGRARKSVEALGRMRPTTAIVMREDREVEVPVDQLQIGDLVMVRPDSTLAADGVVVLGESGVDQSPITGESIPVDKFPVPNFDPDAIDPAGVGSEHRVFAGTINGSGALKIYVTRPANDSTLSRVMRMVLEAESQRSPTQRLTDRFERYFVPAVMALVTVLLFAWIVIDEPFADSFYRAMAVLVGASPCALAIATPSAVLSAVARGGRSGVLFKGGGPLELLGQVEQIAFDKTGTLTSGKPQLTDVVAVDGVDPQQLLVTAAAVERLSPHPLAKAIWMAARDRYGEQSIPRAAGLRSRTGQGVTATLEGREISIGSEALFHNESDEPPIPQSITTAVADLRAAGRTLMIVKDGPRFLGVLGMLDTPRDSAIAMIASLKEMGVDRMVMLSGDHQKVADAVATSVGLDHAHGDLMPEDKVDAVREMTKQRVTAMVGDGVNDAPAMATASVAIAMGAAGSDVAMETADVALMGDDLLKLPFAIGLSRKTSAIVRQNLWISLGMVAILIPAGLLGLNLGAAVVFHEGSTVVVVLNALRLLGYQTTTKGAP
jgi:Cd2+/Zn2+-exporting ATPase